MKDYAEKDRRKFLDQVEQDLPWLLPTITVIAIIGCAIEIMRHWP